MAEIVLVHGAGTGGWLWDLEAEILRQRGHSVTAPTLSGVGDRLAEGGPETSLSTHIDDVIGCVPDHATAGPVLVGFSYGGLVAAGVVDRIPERVAMLVYLDAFVPVPGRSMFDLMPASMAGQFASGCPVQRWRVADAANSLGAARPTRRHRCRSGPVARTRAPGSSRSASDLNVRRAGRPSEPARLTGADGLHHMWDARR